MSPFSPDSIRRFIFERYPVRGFIVHLDSSWRAVLEPSDYPVCVRELLGEAMVSATLLAATLKFDGLLTLQLQAPGPMHLLVAQCTDRHAIRGVARYRDLPAGLGAADLLQRLTGDGRLSVSLESNDQAARYQGVVPLTGNSFASSLEAYFESSEQLPTRIWLAAGTDGAAGFLLQRLPAHERGLASLEEIDELWNRVGHLASTLTAAELLALAEGKLLQRLFPEDDVRLYSPVPVYFQCRCSRERVAGILRSLGEAEVRSILAERGRVEVRCEFCNRAYTFDPVDCAAVFHPPEDTQSSSRLQ
ncbi:MAG TPA: Hsp33 family molecular chaperone HslO [Steroidobacteraceae bacterium]|nr:Hsp33 family molecular chaperone HslO [Steroidobacteraceae bacterium]